MANTEAEAELRKKLAEIEKSKQAEGKGAAQAKDKSSGTNGNAADAAANVSDMQSIKEGGEESRKALLEGIEKANEDSKKTEESQWASEDPADKELAQRFQDKVDKGLVAPPADAPTEVKEKHAQSYEDKRKARWEEQRKLQTEATEGWFKDKTAQEKQRDSKQAGDSPKNVDAAKAIQPGGGGAAPAAPSTTTGNATSAAPGNAGR